MNTIIKCLKCNQVLNEPSDLAESERIPCPTCGSLSRHIELELSDSITFHDIISTKAKHVGKSEPFIEQKAGDDLHRKTGKWMHLKRTIDRENDWYEEVVTDPETGAIIHKCAEPLSKHTEHGSAKYRKS